MKAFHLLPIAGLLLVLSFRFSPQHASAPTQDEMATYYIVVADTSQSYQQVHGTMTDFQKASGQKIDTMGRYYNASAGKLMLPEDDEDELYRGEYFPRRFPDKTLSIEYLQTYAETLPTTFACVVGIYEKPADAKKAVSTWKKRFPKIYSQKARVFVGCMH